MRMFKFTCAEDFLRSVTNRYLLEDGNTAVELKTIVKADKSEILSSMKIAFPETKHLMTKMIYSHDITKTIEVVDDADIVRKWICVYMSNFLDHYNIRSRSTPLIWRINPKTKAKRAFHGDRYGYVMKMYHSCSHDQIAYFKLNGSRGADWRTIKKMRERDCYLKIDVDKWFDTSVLAALDLLELDSTLYTNYAEYINRGRKRNAR